MLQLPAVTSPSEEPCEFPGLPQVVCEILKLTDGDPIDALVDLISQDAPLALKVLGMCNSPALGLRRQVATVGDAVVGLGLRSTRSLVLCTALVDVVGRGEDEAQLEVHRGTLRRAAISRSLAQRVGDVSPQEAFTAGLLADIGRFWLNKRHPGVHSALATLVASGEDPVAVERELTGEDHVALGLMIADGWGLPPRLREIIASHHHADACESTLQRIVFVADLAACIQEALISPPEAQEELSRLCGEWFGLKRKDVPAWLAEAEEVARESAQALSLPAPPATGFDLGVMCQELGRIYIDNERVQRELRDAVRKAQEYADKLRAQVVQLDRAATTDALTGLANRRLIARRLEQEMLEATPERPTAILLIDLDRFKTINDTYGHDGGDVALKSLAAFLKKATRASDLVGRYGGDEFIVVLPGSDGEGARIVAERIRRVIHDTAVRMDDGRELRMAVSVGGCTLPLPQGSREEAITIVDRALYAAKRLGRNKVVWVDEGPAAGSAKGGSSGTKRKHRRAAPPKAAARA